MQKGLAVVPVMLRALCMKNSLKSLLRAIENFIQDSFTGTEDQPVSAINEGLLKFDEINLRLLNSRSSSSAIC